MNEQTVTISNVVGNIDYDKLISEFGVEKIDSVLIEKFERIIKQPVHPWIKRDIFFSH